LQFQPTGMRIEELHGPILHGEQRSELEIPEREQKDQA
jgi:hypothetical protein